MNSTKFYYNQIKFLFDKLDEIKDQMESDPYLDDDDHLNLLALIALKGGRI